MEGFRFTVDQHVVWRDLDALNHVNNAVYATYLENGRLEYMTQVTEGQENLHNLILAELTITYKSPAFLREHLIIGVRTDEIRTSSMVVSSEIRHRETGRLVATSRAVVVHYDYTENKSTPVPVSWRERIAQFEGRAF